MINKKPSLDRRERGAGLLAGARALSAADVCGVHGDSIH